MLNLKIGNADAISNFMEVELVISAIAALASLIGVCVTAIDVALKGSSKKSFMLS